MFIKSPTFLKGSQQKQDVSSGRGLSPLFHAADAGTPVRQLGAVMETLAKQWVSSHSRQEGWHHTFPLMDKPSVAHTDSQPWTDSHTALNGGLFLLSWTFFHTFTVSQSDFDHEQIYRTKAALINIYTITMGEITVCKVEGVICSENPIYHPPLQCEICLWVVRLPPKWVKINASLNFNVQGLTKVQCKQSYQRLQCMKQI